MPAPPTAQDVQDALASTEELLAAATRDGHASLGFADAGRIEVGARAELVSVALDSIRTRGTGASAETLVCAAPGADVLGVVP